MADKKTPIALAILLLALLLFASFAFVDSSQVRASNSTYSRQISAAVSYLARNYNATIGLIHNSPDFSDLNNTYWLYSDNYLANLAMEKCDCLSSTQASTARNISETMEHYIQNNPIIVTNLYTVLTTSAFPFGNYETPDPIIASFGGATIKSTVNNQLGVMSTTNYADVAFLKAIAYWKAGNQDLALQAYRNGNATWHGYGFNDSATGATYTTYKLALYIIASKVLSQTINNLATGELLGLQLHNGVDSGGFATAYTGAGIPRFANGTNTETTSLSILALLALVGISPITTTNNWCPWEYVVSGALGVAIIIFAIVILIRRGSGKPRISSSQSPLDQAETEALRGITCR